MIEVKGNFKKKFENNMTCRACKTYEETQDHVLNTCPMLHQNNTNKVNIKDIFDDNPKHMKIATNKIVTTLDKLDYYIN